MNEHSNAMLGSAKHGIDALSLGVTFASLASWLPSMAAVFSIVWTLIRIFETATVRGLFARLRGRKRK